MSDLWIMMLIPVCIALEGIFSGGEIAFAGIGSEHHPAKGEGWNPFGATGAPSPGSTRVVSRDDAHGNHPLRHHQHGPGHIPAHRPFRAGPRRVDFRGHHGARCPHFRRDPSQEPLQAARREVGHDDRPLHLGGLMGSLPPGVFDLEDRPRRRLRPGRRDGENFPALHYQGRSQVSSPGGSGGHRCQALGESHGGAHL